MEVVFSQKVCLCEDGGSGSRVCWSIRAETSVNGIDLNRKFSEIARETKQRALTGSSLNCYSRSYPFVDYPRSMNEDSGSNGSGGAQNYLELLTRRYECHTIITSSGGMISSLNLGETGTHEDEVHL